MTILRFYRKQSMPLRLLATVRILENASTRQLNYSILKSIQYRNQYRPVTIEISHLDAFKLEVKEQLYELDENDEDLSHEE